MHQTRDFWMRVALAFTAALVVVTSDYAQSSSTTVYHQIEGRLHSRNGPDASNIHVRILRAATRRPIGETFSRSRGEFEFNYIQEGEYLVETYETEVFEATSTSVQVRPIPREQATIFHIEIDLPLKSPKVKTAPGVIAADVDLVVPKEALKHYRAGSKSLADGNPERAVKEFQDALKAYPDYYAARLDLGRELRRQKRFKESEEILAPLHRIAPKRSEPLVEHGLALMELQRRAEAAAELRSAVELDEADWAAHYYLAWALIDEQPEMAEPHFKRALELDESKAARAHLALARLADAKGLRRVAIEHLDAYLLLIPTGPEAEAARQLVERLRKLSQDNKGSAIQP